jgi:hypothetical protein
MPQLESGMPLTSFFRCIVFGPLCIALASPHLHAQQPDSRVPSIINLQEFKRLLALMDKETPVAIVRFETDTLEGFRVGDGKLGKEKNLYPATALVLDEKDRAAVHIQGSFGLEKDLNKKSPQLGHVNQTILLNEPLLNARRSESYKRLQALVPKEKYAAKKNPQRPLFFLAIWPENKVLPNGAS